MSVFKSLDGKEMYVDCSCGCDKGMRFKIEYDPELGDYFMASYTHGRFYVEQGNNFFDVIRLKTKRIWAILRNKEHYYFDIFMTKAEFQQFKEYINSIE